MALSARVPASRIGTTRVCTAAVGVVATGALLAGVTGVLAPLLALALAVGPFAGLTAGRLIRLALAIRARDRSAGPCRGAGFLGMGSLVMCLTVVWLALVPVDARPWVAAGGLLSVTTLLMLGMMLLPGAAVTVADRLRRGLDGLSIGITLSFTFWLLVSPGAVPPLALSEGLITAAALAVMSVVAVRAAAYRWAALLCASGAAATLIGVAGLAVPLAYGGAGRALLASAVGLLGGPALALFGARRAGDQHAVPVPGGLVLAGYPMLTVPIIMALAMAFYHLVAVGEFDRTAMAMGLVSAIALVVREALSSADVRRYARRLAGREAHFRSLVAGASDLILILDDQLVVQWQSPAAARLFGLSDQDVLGRPFLTMLHPEDVTTAGALLTGVVERRRDTGRPNLLPARLRDGFGAWRDTESTVSDQRDVPDIGALVLHLRDVGERRQLELTLHRMSSTDQLTSLPNRRELLRVLAEWRGMGRRAGALLAVDLHGLTAVNDERGREVGDAVLVEAARRLRATLGADDMPARLSGDEFAVVTMAGPMLAYALGTRLLAELTRPYQVPGTVVILHASVGLAELGAGDGVDDVVQHADLACRRAQQLGRDRLEWYDTYLEEQLTRRLDLERELPGAVARGEFDLVFQPVVQLFDRQPVGVEALLRWRHRVLGTVLPTEVLPVAEDLGMAGEVAGWVLSTACRHLSCWLGDGLDLWVAVNMSPGQLVAPTFVAQVEAALTGHQVRADRLVIEMAEARLGEVTPPVLTQLANLRELGVRTALDGFGAGQASLAQLRRLPVDILKVDGALVSQPSSRQGPTRPLIDVVVSLGRRLGLELIAEGVESRTRLEEAINAGCRLGQGHLLGRPMPAEHLEAYLENFRAPSL